MQPLYVRNDKKIGANSLTTLEVVFGTILSVVGELAFGELEIACAHHLGKVGIGCESFSTSLATFECGRRRILWF